MGSTSNSNSNNVNSGLGTTNGVNSGVNGSFNTSQTGNVGVNNSGNFGFNVGSGSSKGGGSSSSASADRIWGEQAGYLTDVYGKAQDAFGKTMAEIEGLTPEMTAQVQDAYNQGMGGFTNALGGGFAAGMMDQVGENAYTDALKGDILSDAGKLKQQTLGSLDARAAAAGMSGSSGYRDQVADSFNQIDENALAQMNQLGFNSFNQGLQNKLALTGQMDANANNALGMTGAMQQAALAQALPAMMGQQAANLYAQTIGGPTTLNSSSSRSSNSSQSQNNSFGMNNGFANGMNMGFGNTMGGGFGTTGGINSGTNVNSGVGNSSSNSVGIDGAGVAAGLGAFSDADLKENIRLVENIDGVNLYEWDWKDPEISSPMNYGVIAQEVALTHPDAVSVADNGYLVVDYTQLGAAGSAALARMGG